MGPLILGGGFGGGGIGDLESGHIPPFAGAAFPGATFGTAAPNAASSVIRAPPAAIAASSADMIYTQLKHYTRLNTHALGTNAHEAHAQLLERTLRYHVTGYCTQVTVSLLALEPR